jgi:formylmethanofuran dehydrogenase subunit E
MEAETLKIDADFAKLIEKAEDLHGHLGPFLIIGVRMGNIAKRILNPNTDKNNGLQATAKTPLSTPFSCVLDGIQITTQCTVGNQKLKIETSKQEVTALFKVHDSNKVLKITVNSKIVDELVNRLSEGTSNEDLARKIAYTPEDTLFTIEKP